MPTLANSQSRKAFNQSHPVLICLPEVTFRERVLWQKAGFVNRSLPHSKAKGNLLELNRLVLNEVKCGGSEQGQQNVNMVSSHVQDGIQIPEGSHCQD